MPEHLDRLLAETDVVPAVNQIEVHPYFRQTGALEANTRHDITSQAWSPIGGITFYPGWGADRTSTLEAPEPMRIAAAHGKTPAQVILRWHLQQGRSAIPKSVTPRPGSRRTWTCSTSPSPTPNSPRSTPSTPATEAAAPTPTPSPWSSTV